MRDLLKAFCPKCLGSDLALRTALAAVALVAAAGVALAGDNATATCKMSWLTDPGTCARGQGVSCVNTTKPTAMVTASGLHTIRGWDVEIVVMGTGGQGLQPAWQFQTGGCAGPARLTMIDRPQGMICSPSAASWIPGIAQAQREMFYNFSSCLTPNGQGLVWDELAGSSYDPTGGGIGPIDPSREYALCSIAFDETGGASSDGQCAGNCSHGAAGVCILLRSYLPCTEPPHGASVALLDANNNIDYAPATPGYDEIDYNGAHYYWQLGECLSPTDKVHSATWGSMRRMYH